MRKLLRQFLHNFSEMEYQDDCAKNYEKNAQICWSCGLKTADSFHATVYINQSIKK